MTKRDAIEAMARAMQGMEWAGNQPLNVHDDAIAIAITAYNTIAEMAKAERKAQSAPATPGPTGEAVAH